MREYYSDYITENFYKKLNKIKEESDYKESSSLRLEGFNFFFISNIDDVYTCEYVEESQLKTTKVEDSVVYIVVFMKMHQHYCDYWNKQYELIGIFDSNGTETDIQFDSVKLCSFDLSSDFGGYHYNKDIIRYAELTIINNPFKQFLKKALKPMNKAITEALPREYDIVESELLNDDMPITIDYKDFYAKEYIIPDDFQDFLDSIDTFDRNITKKLFSQYGTPKFKPEDYQ